MSPLFLWSLAGALAFFPAVLWLLYWYKKGNMSEVGKRRMIRSFFFGAVGIIPLLCVKYALGYAPDLVFVWEVIRERWFFFSTLLLIIVLALLEEFLKGFSIVSARESDVSQSEHTINIVLYFMSAGLGFAFMENLLYFRDTLLVVGLHQVFWRVFFFRSLGTMLGHALFSGIFGLFWVHAAFSRQKHTHTPDSLKDAWKSFFAKFQLDNSHAKARKRGFFQKHHSRIHLMLEGVFAATFLHAIFNFLLSPGVGSVNTILFVPPFLVLLFIFVSRQMGAKSLFKIS